MIKKIIILMLVCIIEINAMDSDFYHSDTPPALKRKLSYKFHTISPVRIKAIIEEMNKELPKNKRFPEDWDSITKISCNIAESRNSFGNCDKKIKDLIISFLGAKHLEA